MKRTSKRMLARNATILTALFVVGVSGAPALAAPDHYLCYKAAIARGEPRFPKGLSKSLEDRLGGPQTFDVTKITRICNPADRNGTGITHSAVHLEGYAIKKQKGASRFTKSNHVVTDPFAQRTLTITGPTWLLDVTPKALGTTPPAPFDVDPTSDPTVNRFKCYKAAPAKGSARFVAPAAAAVTDQFFAAGQLFDVRKVTALCEPVDEDGETPGAESRETSLVCYAVKLTKGTPRFSTRTVATNDANFAPHVLVAKAPAELCLPAARPTATPTPIATPTFTPSPALMRRVFVTSTSHTGNLGGTAGADAICAQHASAAGVSGTFKAWLSITGDSPSSRFTQSAVPYVLVDDTVIALDWNDLTDGTIAHAINEDENGTTVAFDDVWTATTTSGTASSADCNDFASTAGTGQCGRLTQTNVGWTNYTTTGCGTPLRLYCFEQ